MNIGCNERAFPLACLSVNDDQLFLIPFLKFVQKPVAFECA